MKTRPYDSRVAPARQNDASGDASSLQERPKVQQIEVGERGAGQRLDNFLGRILKDVPRTHLFRVIRKGEVRVNGKRAKADTRLQASDIVRVFAVANRVRDRIAVQGDVWAPGSQGFVAGMKLSDIDLVEMHEAFAAQVLSNLDGFESKEWAARAGFAQPVGQVDRSRLNVMGGSIAIGHPFGATGARIMMTLAHELKRRGGQFGLMTVCAAGGMGFAMVLEAA